jgi:hypothetical protein
MRVGEILNRSRLRNASLVFIGLLLGWLLFSPSSPAARRRQAELLRVLYSGAAYTHGLETTSLPLTGRILDTELIADYAIELDGDRVKGLDLHMNLTAQTVPVEACMAFLTRLAEEFDVPTKRSRPFIENAIASYKGALSQPFEELILTYHGASLSIVRAPGSSKEMLFVYVQLRAAKAND